MRQWGRTASAGGIAISLIASAGTLAHAAAPCDEYNPSGPMRTTQITLNATDYTDDQRDQMRSFLETDSIGRVDVAIVGSTPRDAVLSVTAVPEISRVSGYFGEELRGIAVNVWLRPTARAAQVTLKLRQVCARRFRNTFLYY